MKRLNVVILAAGKGERMKSKRPKVVHGIMGKPMIGHVVDRAGELDPDVIVVVVGHGKETVEWHLKDRHVLLAEQTEQKGTAHALLAAEKFLGEGDILVLYGDVPMVQYSTLREFLDFSHATGDIVFMVTDVRNPKGYGRVIMEEDRIIAIVEDNEATEEQKSITTINTGICVIPGSSFSFLREIVPSNNKGEYYLTDICTIAGQKGKAVRGYRHQRPSEVLGINSRKELLEANTAMKDRILDSIMEQGVTLLDRNIYIEAGVTIGRDSMIAPNCHIMGNTTIGEDVIIGPNCIINNAVIEEGTIIEAFTTIENSRIVQGAVIGDYMKIKDAGTVDRKPKTHSPGSGRNN